MELRQQLVDFTHGGRRWIASLVARQEDVVWRGRLRFFEETVSRGPLVHDRLGFEAYTADDLVAQASALSMNEFRLRLERGKQGAS